MKLKNGVIIDNDMDLSILTNDITIISSGYAASRVGKQKVLIHHLVLPKKPGFLVDHINRNKLDNRKVNLRYLNRSHNAFNSGLWKHNSTGIRGLYRLRDRKRPGWRTAIKYNGYTYGERFDCPYLAVRWLQNFYAYNNIPGSPATTGQGG